MNFTIVTDLIDNLTINKGTTESVLELITSIILSCQSKVQFEHINDTYYITTFDDFYAVADDGMSMKYINGDTEILLQRVNDEWELTASYNNIPILTLEDKKFEYYILKAFFEKYTKKLDKVHDFISENLTEKQ